MHPVKKQPTVGPIVPPTVVSTVREHCTRATVHLRMHEATELDFQKVNKKGKRKESRDQSEPWNN